MTSRPKILFVTPASPLLDAYGAQQRVLNISRLLSRFGDVSFFLVPHDPDYEQTASRTSREVDIRRIVRELPIEGNGHLDRLRHRLRYELDPAYLATHHLTARDEDRRALLQLMQGHDLTWVHTIRTANLFGIHRWHRSVLDVDDLPSRVYRSNVESDGNPIRRLLDSRLSSMWHRRERLLTDRFDAVSVCSEEDRQYLGGHARIHVIPNGFNRPETRRQLDSESPRVGFIGTCKYRPNAEGVEWFIREVWPLVKRDLPSAQLRLIGRETEGYLTKLGLDICGLGWVEDPSNEVATWSAMIVPIRSGGGTRIKIAEGFARKCPVVATKLGAFGYDVSHGKELLLTDTASDFASACVSLVRDPQLAEAIAERAHRRFLEKWTWDSFEKRVKTVVDECISSNEPDRDGILTVAS
jgi:polysaccharide biosynthesis protein PslH